MRHFLLLLSILLASSFQAQVMLGNRFGWSLNKQYLDGSVDPPDLGAYSPPHRGLYDDIPFSSGGFAGAFTVDVPITGQFLLGAEVGYSERGYVLHRSISGSFSSTGASISNVMERFKTGHLGLSILPKVRVGGGRVRGEFFAGADIARWLNLHHQRHPFAYMIREADSYIYHMRRSKLFADHAISLVGGAGLVVGSGPVLLHVNARYIHGITNIYETPILITDPYGFSAGGGRMFDRSILFSIGYSVSLSPSSWRQPE